MDTEDANALYGSGFSCSWILYCIDLTVCGMPRKNIGQFLVFLLEVAMTFLAQHDENSDFLEQEDDPDILGRSQLFQNFK